MRICKSVCLDCGLEKKYFFRLGSVIRCKKCNSANMWNTEFQKNGQTKYVRRSSY